LPPFFLRGIAPRNEGGAHPDIIKCASIDDRWPFGFCGAEML